MDKNKSLSIMQIVMAIFIALAPVCIAASSTGVFAVAFLFPALLLLRIKDMQKIHISIYHFISMFLLFYSIIASFWASNKEGHLIYLFMLGALIAFFTLAIDYYENSRNGIERRMMYMLWVSGTLCAFLNIAYWIMYIVPVAGKSSFSQGMGNSDLLAVFMLLCIWTALILVKGNSALRKHLLVVCVAAMFFVFVMAKSLIAWIFIVVIAFLYVIRKKSEKIFYGSALGALLIFETISILMLRASSYGIFHRDTFSYALKHMAGLGGGFESAWPMFLTHPDAGNAGAGLFLQLFANAGPVGAFCAVAICVFCILHFVKLKTMTSLIEVFITAMIMTLPLSQSPVPLLLWVGIMAYNECLSEKYIKRAIIKKYIDKITCIITVICIIAATSFAHSLIRNSGDRKFENEAYNEAYNLYAAAAGINIADSQSCYMAAKSLRKGGEIEKNSEAAIRLIDKAIRRDRKNPAYTEEKAKIYYACKNYEMSAAIYKEMAKSAIVSGRYNLELVKSLYQVMKQNPKGSSEAKRIYEQIVEIGRYTEELSYRKEINDIADEALSYTKGDFVGEKIGD